MINFTVYIMLENSTKLEELNITLEQYYQLLQLITNNTNKPETTKSTCGEFDWSIEHYAVIYAASYHVYLALIVCIFGAVFNILNIIVLTRKDMASVPINKILTGIAMADVVVMIEYVLYVYYYRIELPRKKDFPYWGAAFILFHSHFAQIFHTISICLTLTLAIWRYLAIG